MKIRWTTSTKRYLALGAELIQYDGVTPFANGKRYAGWGLALRLIFGSIWLTKLECVNS